MNNIASRIGTTDIILLLIFAAVVVLGWFWRRKVVRTIAKSEDGKPTKGQKRLRTFTTALIVFGLYLFATRAVFTVFGPHESEPFEFSIWADRVNLFGLNVSQTVLYSWCVMAVLIILALVIRFTVIRRWDADKPAGLQNALETAVEMMLKYTNSNVHGIGEILASYLFSLALFMVGCACVELFGLRTPASDIMFTFAMGLITYFLMNWYGIKKKGVAARVKSFSSSFFIKFITDLAIPVSMACRLFGNMLGGLIIMDLVYSALGNNAIGIPSVVGLYFNVAHPLLQTFIFVTLTLAFINEAIE
ncbi:MAG: F0F1 ATP synthase subunit A [Oscillospiraceae bacterium]|nr:F0F1 ATP synthase subunit A [Oscillospiraceae bacterium]